MANLHIRGVSFIPIVNCSQLIKSFLLLSLIYHLYFTENKTELTFRIKLIFYDILLVILQVYKLLGFFQKLLGIRIMHSKWIISSSGQCKESSVRPIRRRLSGVIAHAVTSCSTGGAQTCSVIRQRRARECLESIVVDAGAEVFERFQMATSRVPGNVQICTKMITNHNLKKKIYE